MIFTKEQIESLKALASENQADRKKAVEDFIEIAKQSVSDDLRAISDIKGGKLSAGEARAALDAMNPTRMAVFRRDLVGNVFMREDLPAGASSVYPISFIQEGDQDEFTAVVLPKNGMIPERHVAGDEIYVPTFTIETSIDTNMQYIRDGRWNIVQKMFDTIAGGIVRKNNYDAFSTVMVAAASAAQSAITWNDGSAGSGVFSKTALLRAQTKQARRVNEGVLTDIYISPEARESILAWGVTELDDVARRELYLSQAADSADYGTFRLYGVNFHTANEFGSNGEFQALFTGAGGTLASGDGELAIGLDLRADAMDSFVMPVREDVRVEEDPTLKRSLKFGVFAYQDRGFATLNSLRVLPISI